MRSVTGTARGCRETVARLAVSAFAPHVLTAVRPGMWKVARPDRWMHGFYLLTGPGMLMVYGDIEEAVLRMTEPEDGVIPWLRGALQSRDYLFSKLRSPTELRGWKAFYPDDALAWVAEQVTTATADVKDDPAGEGGWARRRVRQATQLDRDARVAHAACELHQHAWLELVTEAGYDDCYNVGVGWSSAAHWTAEALACFVRLHDMAAQVTLAHEVVTELIAEEGTRG